MNQDRIRNLFIGGTFALTQLSGSLYIPSLPTLTNVFGVSRSEIMFTLSIFFFGYALGQLLWGTASDYIGRKKTLLTSLSLYICVAITITFARDYHFFAILMASLGFMAAAYTSVGNALLKDLFGKKVGTAIGYVGIGMAVAPMLAPVIGAHLILWFNWRAIYFFLAIYALCSFIAISITVKDQPKIKLAHDDTGLFPVIKKILTNPNFMSYALPLGMMFGALFSYLGATSFIFTKYFGYSLAEFGYIVFTTMTTYVLGTVLNSFWIKHKSPNVIMKTGLLISLLGAMIVFLLTVFKIHYLIVIIIPLAIFVLGIGLIIPSSKAGAMQVFENHSGKSSSMMKFIQIIVSALITAIAAKLHSPTSLVPISSFLLFITILSFSLCYLCSDFENISDIK